MRTDRKNQSPANQLCAIEAIKHLVLEFPPLSAALRSQGAGKYLKLVLPDARHCHNAMRGPLYARTREALACVEEVEVL